MSYPSEIESLRAELELMEKEILKYKGKKLSIAKEKYLRLLHTCGKNCDLESSVYIDHV